MYVITHTIVLYSILYITYMYMRYDVYRGDADMRNI